MWFSICGRYAPGRVTWNRTRPVVLAAEACSWTDELGDLDGLHTGLLAPPFVGATFGATVAVELIEEQQAALVDQRCQPSKRTHRRRLEIGVERRERDSADSSSQSVIEGVVEVADNQLHAAQPRQFARTSRGQRFERLGKPTKRVTCEQPPTSDLRLLAPQAAQLTAAVTRDDGRCARAGVFTTRRGRWGPRPRPSNVAFVGASGSGHRAHGDSYSLRPR